MGSKALKGSPMIASRCAAVAAFMTLAASAALAAPLGMATLGEARDSRVFQAQASASTMTVRVKSARLRAEPSAKGKRVASLKRGTKVQVVGTSGDWTQVRAGGQSGYVMTNLLR
jgi:uncharacterized protein YgiM (DUF1202 family)